MSDCFITRRGGSGSYAGGYNFRLFPKNKKPANPKENDMYFADIDKIDRWVISDESPSGMVDNMVWIKSTTNFSSFINASSKNVLKVYLGPVTIQQNGIMQICAAEVYTGGKWVVFSAKEFYIFNNGDITDITGGWTGPNLTVGNTLSIYRETIGADQVVTCYAGPNNKLMLSGLKTCTIVYSRAWWTKAEGGTTYGTSMSCAVTDANGVSRSSGQFPRLYNGTGTRTIDLTGLSGESTFTIMYRTSYNNGEKCYVSLIVKSVKFS